LLRLDVDRCESIAWIDRNHDGSIARAWTWIEVQRLAAAAATFVLDHSVGRGDRVVNLGRNSLAWAILDLACSAIDAVHVPIDGRFSISQQKHCIDLVKPTLVFSDGPSASGPSASGWSELGQLTSLLPTDQTLQQIASPFSPDNLANILFTSGTTGVQKGMNVRIDESGRLWVSGDGIMLGYWQDTEGTKTKIVNGWLDTGDLAEYVDSTNCVESPAIRILGRADDTLVLSSGYKVQPLPIEQLVLTESWVSQCILVGTKIPFTILIVRTLEADYPTMRANEMLARIVGILHEFPKYAIPCKVIVAKEEWTKKNGLLNFKGGLIRKKIESYYQSQLVEPSSDHEGHRTLKQSR